MNSRKKIDQLGFSLMEIMIAIGMLGVLTLGVMKVMDMQTKSAKQMDNKLNEGEIFRRISTILANSDACYNTLNNIEANKTIRNATGKVIYRVGDKIGSVKIEAINLSGDHEDGDQTVTVTVTLRRMGLKTGVPVIRKRFSVDVKYKDNKLLTCYLDKENLVTTAISEVKRSLSTGDMRFKTLSILTPDGNTGIKIIPGGDGQDDKLVLKGNIYIEDKYGRQLPLAEYIIQHLTSSLTGETNNDNTTIACPSKSFSMSSQVSYCPSEDAQGNCTDGLQNLDCSCTIVVNDGVKGATFNGSCRSPNTAKACTTNGSIGCKQVSCPRIIQDFLCQSTAWIMSN